VASSQTIIENWKRVVSPTDYVILCGDIGLSPKEHLQKIFNRLNGKIIRAECSQNSDNLQHLIATDEGAKYIGEFALGLNPFVDIPIKDILFDEKMLGSFHIAIGNSYPNAYNGNRSAIHWDLIQSQKVEHGGGKIFVDDRLIMEDGSFVFPGSEHLNPDNLIKLLSAKSNSN